MLTLLPNIEPGLYYEYLESKNQGFEEAKLMRSVTQPSVLFRTFMTLIQHCPKNSIQ